jgi:hypothetical protein
MQFIVATDNAPFFSEWARREPLRESSPVELRWLACSTCGARFRTNYPARRPARPRKQQRRRGPGEAATACLRATERAGFRKAHQGDPAFSRAQPSDQGSSPDGARQPEKGGLISLGEAWWLLLLANKLWATRSCCSTKCLRERMAWSQTAVGMGSNRADGEQLGVDGLSEGFPSSYRRRADGIS